MQDSAAELKEQARYISDSRKDVELVTNSKSGAADSAEEEAGPYGRTPADSPPQDSRGQGRPPLSPVRQSLQDLAVSGESISIDPMTGMPKQDMNVHCNPLFTEPMALQQSSEAPSKQGIGQRKAVPASPPSKLKQSLRTLLQQHTERIEVGLACPCTVAGLLRQQLAFVFSRLTHILIVSSLH